MSTATTTTVIQLSAAFYIKIPVISYAEMTRVSQIDPSDQQIDSKNKCVMKR